MRYSKEFISDILLKTKHLGATEASKKTGIPVGTLNYWRKKRYGCTSRIIEENYQTGAVKHIKYGIYTKEIRDDVLNRVKEIGVSETCRETKIPRSTVEYWVLHDKLKHIRYESEIESLNAKIVELEEKNKTLSGLVLNYNNMFAEMVTLKPEEK